MSDDTPIDKEVQSVDVGPRMDDKSDNVIGERLPSMLMPIVAPSSSGSSNNCDNIPYAAGYDALKLLNVYTSDSELEEVVDISMQEPEAEFYQEPRGGSGDEACFPIKSSKNLGSADSGHRGKANECTTISHHAMDVTSTNSPIGVLHRDTNPVIPLAHLSDRSECAAPVSESNEVCRVMPSENPLGVEHNGTSHAYPIGDMRASVERCAPTAETASNSFSSTDISVSSIDTDHTRAVVTRPEPVPIENTKGNIVRPIISDTPIDKVDLPHINGKLRPKGNQVAYYDGIILNEVISEHRVHQATEVVNVPRKDTQVISVPQIQQDTEVISVPMVQQDTEVISVPMVQQDTEVSSVPMVQQDTEVVSVTEAQQDTEVVSVPMVQQNAKVVSVPMVQQDTEVVSVPMVQQDTEVISIPMVQQDTEVVSVSEVQQDTEVISIPMVQQVTEVINVSMVQQDTEVVSVPMVQQDTSSVSMIPQDTGSINDTVGRYTASSNYTRSDTEDSDSSSSSDASDVELDNRDEDSEHVGPKKRFGPVTKGELTLLELPAIEHLQITVPEEQCTRIGVVASVVDTLVVVDTVPDTPALDIDSILFLHCGKHVLGRIFDVMGSVNQPSYCVRFNTVDEIREFGIEAGVDVYYVPGSDTYTQFVFLQALRQIRGSDASWWDCNEPPDDHQDFSDDEAEKMWKKSRKRSFSCSSAASSIIAESSVGSRRKMQPARCSNIRPQLNSGGPSSGLQRFPSNSFSVPSCAPSNTRVPRWGSPTFPRHTPPAFCPPIYSQQAVPCSAANPFSYSHSRPRRPPYQPHPQFSQPRPTQSFYLPPPGPPSAVRIQHPMSAFSGAPSPVSFCDLSLPPPPSVPPFIPQPINRFPN